MLRFAILSLVFVYANARPYSSNAGLALSPGLQLSSGLQFNNGYGAPLVRNYGPISAAIQTQRAVEVIPVQYAQELAPPQIIEVEPSEQPVQMIFRSSTSPLLVEQIHQKGVPHHESTRSEEEPSHLVHEVYKPVIQEFREVIQPFRKITQEVKPVLEEVHTVVAKGEDRSAVASVAKSPVVAKERPY